ncbi:hypothetical protein Tco_0531718 [Tanacetum coccineum]
MRTILSHTKEGRRKANWPDEHATKIGLGRFPICNDDERRHYRCNQHPFHQSRNPIPLKYRGTASLTLFRNEIGPPKFPPPIKSSVEDLVPIPSEPEGIPDSMCDVPLCNNPTSLEAFKEHSETIIDSNDDSTSSDDDSYEKHRLVDLGNHLPKKRSSLRVWRLTPLIILFPNLNFRFNLEELISSGSPTTHSDLSLLDYKAFYVDNDHFKERSSGSTTTHVDFSQYDSFIFDLSNDQFPPADRSDSYHEEFADGLAHIISPPEYDRFLL